MKAKHTMLLFVMCCAPLIGWFAPLPVLYASIAGYIVGSVLGFLVGADK